MPGVATGGVHCQAANNNLDVCRDRGRTYLAWRTAPSHFASPAARLEVTSCELLDGPWRHEATVELGCDVREPRWIVGPDGPQLWFVRLGVDPKRFQPGGVWRVRKRGAGWAEPEAMLDSTTMMWRIRRFAEGYAMFSYRGAEAMYSPRPRDPAVELRWSEDLDVWSDPVTIHPGGTEFDAVQRRSGTSAGGPIYVGVSRNEGPSRRGGDVVAGDSLTDLRVMPIARKPDSPLVFEWRGEVWCWARRSLRAGGTYDRVPRATPGSLAIRVDQAWWSLSRKRSSLYRVDAVNGRLDWQLDLPSRGDCSFAALVDVNDDELLVADYSTPSSRRDGSWIRGQLGPTEIRLWSVRVG